VEEDFGGFGGRDSEKEDLKKEMEKIIALQKADEGSSSNTEVRKDRGN